MGEGHILDLVKNKNFNWALCGCSVTIYILYEFLIYPLVLCVCLYTQSPHLAGAKRDHSRTITAPITFSNGVQEILGQYATSLLG